MQTAPESYPIADFLKWHRQRELVLNPDFQRGSVWKDSAKSYLIDTILRGMPIPKILFRTSIDRNSMQISREVVDGQQRLRAIIAFANDDLRLGRRAHEFSGKRYSDLDDEAKDAFLAYKLTTEQLINATNDDVLEIFVRINSYTVPVNAPELRHAKFDSDFKWSIVDVTNRLTELWALGTLSDRERVRMLDASLVAEFYGTVLDGITDGGQPAINRLYSRYKEEFPHQRRVEASVIEVGNFIPTNLLYDLAREPIVGPPQILMLFAAVAYAKGLIPLGALKPDEAPSRDGLLKDLDQARANLQRINDVLSADAPSGKWAKFWSASKSSTQRIASRRTRFPVYVNALRNVPLK